MVRYQMHNENTQTYEKFIASGGYGKIMSMRQRMPDIDDLDLPEWLIEGAKKLMKHPLFDAALCAQAEAVTSIFESTFALVKVISEEARYVISAALIAMHSSRDPFDPASGATVTRLQQFAEYHGLAGSNRVAAIIALMRHLGYVQQVQARSDRRIRRLEPTDYGLSVARRMTSAALTSIQLFSEGHDYQELIRSDENFMGRFFAESLRHYNNGARITYAMPEFNLFGQQNGGREVMFKLWLALAERGPREPMMVSCPYGELARSLGVSRGHVRRMIEKGEERGLFRVRAAGGQAIEILPDFIYLHRTFTALEYALMLPGAEYAASTTGRPQLSF